MKNTCYTCFRIVGSFDPAAVTEWLGLQPERSHGAQELRRDGKPYGFAVWEIGKCDEYSAEISGQMRKTIAPLLDKTALLNRLREEKDVRFYLEIVPCLYADEPSPCLAPPLDIVDFCHATRT